MSTVEKQKHWRLHNTSVQVLYKAPVGEGHQVLNVPSHLEGGQGWLPLEIFLHPNKLLTTNITNCLDAS